MINFYAYFSAYGNGGYDPNDVNFTETRRQSQQSHRPDIPRPVSGARCDLAQYLRVAGTKPLHQRPDRAVQHGHDPRPPCPRPTESADVPDHLVGDRWAVWRGRAVQSRHHGGGPAVGPDHEPQWLCPLRQHRGCDHPDRASGTTSPTSTTASWNDYFCIPVEWVQPTAGGATPDGGLHPPSKERNRTRRRDCRSWVKCEQGR